MPSWVKNEDKWAKAKEIVKKEYDLSEKDGDKFWKLVAGVYKQMGGKVASTRLRKNAAAEIQEHILLTSPLYNPLGKGEDDSEFKDSDAKSYEQWFNKNTLEQAEKRHSEESN